MQTYDEVRITRGKEVYRKEAEDIDRSKIDPGLKLVQEKERERERHRRGEEKEVVLSVVDPIWPNLKATHKQIPVRGRRRGGGTGESETTGNVRGISWKHFFSEGLGKGRKVEFYVEQNRRQQLSAKRIGGGADKRGVNPGFTLTFQNIGRNYIAGSVVSIIPQNWFPLAHLHLCGAWVGASQLKE
ncbi:hypothetical protein J6590_061867 [Homalodisca vitripennis]|nr:hypothetical protein J6590_061867 [Homalodisca vitripennis]